jgi:glutathione S-transferase
MLPFTALVSLAAIALYFYMGFAVAMARGRYGVKAPAVTGHEMFERTYRVHMNTLEWLPLLLVPLWLFAAQVSDRYAALIGLAWIIGRIIYMRAYMQDPASRSLGFMVQMAACAVLFVGSLAGIVLKML